MRIKTLVSVGLVLWAWSGVPVFAEQQYPTGPALILVPPTLIRSASQRSARFGARPPSHIRSVPYTRFTFSGLSSV